MASFKRGDLVRMPNKHYAIVLSIEEGVVEIAAQGGFLYSCVVDDMTGIPHPGVISSTMPIPNVNFKDVLDGTCREVGSIFPDEMSEGEEEA